jgi:hypothetical protein
MGVTEDDSNSVMTFISIDEGYWIRISSIPHWQGIISMVSYDVGYHEISFIAFDGELLSAPEIIIINKIPYLPIEIRIQVPRQDSYFETSQKISGEVIGGYGEIQLIQVRIDNGEWIDISINRHWEYLLDPKGKDYGPIRFSIRAADNCTYSNIHTLTMNYYKPPVLEIHSPSEKTSFYSTILISGTVDGGYNETIQVEIRISDGLWEPFNESRNWTYVLEKYYVPLGLFELNFRAFDGYQYSDIVELNLIRKKKPHEKEDYFIILLLIIFLLGISTLLLIYQKRKRNI